MIFIDVINYYNKQFTTIKTTGYEIKKQLEYGISNKNIKILEKYVKIGKKYLKNDNNESIEQLIVDAEYIIMQKEEIIKEQLKIKKEGKIPQKSPVEDVSTDKAKEVIEVKPMTYMPQRRPKGKMRVLS